MDNRFKVSGDKARPITSMCIPFISDQPKDNFRQENRKAEAEKKKLES
jgi:aspartate-semialdehyde dehydrogenase